MESSAENSVDDTVNQLINTIKCIHDNAVASLGKDIVRLKAEFRELKTEKTQLLSQYDLLNDEQLILAGNLKSELNKKGLMYQLLEAFTKTLSSSRCSTTGIHSMSTDKTQQDTSCTKNALSHLQSTSFINSASTAIGEKSNARECDEPRNSERFEGRQETKLPYTSVRLCALGRSNTSDPTMECTQNSSISKVSRKPQQKELRTEDASVSPMTHLLNLVSSTHQLTVRPLRMEILNLTRGIEQMKRERDEVNMKIKWIRSEVQNGQKKLEIENSHNEQMKDLFRILSHRVTTDACPSTDRQDPFNFLKAQDLPPKPNISHAEDCEDMPSMVRTSKQPENTTTDQPPEVSILGNEDIIIELQGDATVECRGYTSEDAIPSTDRETCSFSVAQSCSGSSTVPNLSSICSPPTMVIPRSLEKSATVSQSKGIPLIPSTEQTHYQCNICTMGFPDYITLSKHKRCHRSVENICRFCKRPFSSSTALKIHMRRHTGERPYMCQECGKSFAQAISLRIHLRKHTGERPHKCFDCGREFHDPCYFKKHQRKHLENKFKK